MLYKRLYLFVNKLLFTMIARMTFNNISQSQAKQKVNLFYKNLEPLKMKNIFSFKYNAFKYCFVLLICFIMFGRSSNVMAQCAPTCQLEGVGMQIWMGDNDAQGLGDLTSDDEDGDDFIIYRNYGNTAVNISGWELYSDVKGSTTPVFTFPSGTILQPGQTATVVGDWNPGPALPSGWFDANFNVGGEGMFEETSNNLSYAILRNPTSNQYITNHQQGISSTGQSLASGTKVCNYNATTLIPNDFEGCQAVFWDFNTCAYVKITDCTLPFLLSCLAGNVAPTFASPTVSNVCPSTTVNLTNLSATNKPAGTELTWHTGTPASFDNKLTATQASASPPGTYYAAFYDQQNSCYSGTSGSATTAVTATSTSCTPPVAGQCVNILTNPSFESPVQPNVNANNTIIGLTFNGWTASANTSANPFNIIKVDGTGYSVGPDKAADGIQYLDIVGSAIVTQTFTVPTGGAFVKYSGSYANRETSGGYSPSYNYITLLNSSGTIVGTSSAVDLIASIGEEKWFSVFGFTGTRLPAGTYTYKVVIGNFTHFDNASVCLQTDAPAGTIDCAKTQISSAPVFGTAGQKTLSVTTNITTAGCFGPLIVSGSGMSLPDGFTQLCTNTTGIQTFSIPVNYDGSALSTMSFTLGALGTCTADLTKAPKKAICDIWTLECVPTAAPSLK